MAPRLDRTEGVGLVGWTHKGQLYLLFLLLKTDTARACSMSLSLISSLCFPLFQKSKATSVILSAPALLKKQL